MQRIDSPQNPQIKALKRARAKPSAQFFLVEGTKLVQEAMASRVVFHAVYATIEYAANHPEIVQLLRQKGFDPVTVSARVMRAISDVETPPGIIAAAATQTHMPGQIEKFAAMLFSIRDPGNFGAILRVAESTGCAFLAYTPDCVEPFHPKVVRASMGSIFRMPVLEISDTTRFLDVYAPEGFHTYALSPHTGIDIFQCRLQAPALIFIGSESHGLPAGIKAEHQIKIPMKGKVESLNAAMAASIILYRASIDMGMWE